MVKSFGPKNSTRHLPGAEVLEILGQEDCGAPAAAAGNSNEGKGSPTVNMMQRSA